MRGIRDFILVVCSVTTTLCIVYLVYNIEVLRVRLGDSSSPFGPLEDSRHGGQRVTPSVFAEASSKIGVQHTRGSSDAQPMRHGAQTRVNENSK
jgi:hypothetical protein